MRMLTIEQAAHRYGISRTSLWRYVKSGQLIPYRIGSRVRYNVDDLDALFHGPLLVGDETAS